MPPTVVTGPIATDTIASTARVVDMARGVAELEPAAAPLVTLLKRLKKQKARGPKVEWHEGEPMPRFDLLNGAKLAADTTLTVDNGGYFRVGDFLRVPSTGEGISVTAVSGNDLTVVRAIGGVAAADIADNAELFIVSNANAEGAGLRVIKSVRVVNAYNYTQIIRTPLGVTGTEAATENYTGNERDRLQGLMGIEHMRQWEQTAFFGARKEDLTVSGAPKRHAGGLNEFIATNVTNAAGTLSESTWLTFLRTGFRYGSGRKLFFGAPLVIQAIEGFARANYTVNQSDDPGNLTYGLRVRRYISSHGEVDIVRNVAWSDSTVYRGWGFLVDLDNVAYRPLRDTKLLENRQDNDEDKIEDEYLTEATFEIRQERTHAILKGVTG